MGEDQRPSRPVPDRVRIAEPLPGPRDGGGSSRTPSARPKGKYFGSAFFQPTMRTTNKAKEKAPNTLYSFHLLSQSNTLISRNSTADPQGLFPQWAPWVNTPSGPEARTTTHPRITFALYAAACATAPHPSSIHGQDRHLPGSACCRPPGGGSYMAHHFPRRLAAPGVSPLLLSASPTVDLSWARYPQGFSTSQNVRPTPGVFASCVNRAPVRTGTVTNRIVFLPAPSDQQSPVATMGVLTQPTYRVCAGVFPT